MTIIDTAYKCVSSGQINYRCLFYALKLARILFHHGYYTIIWDIVNFINIRTIPRTVIAKIKYKTPCNLMDFTLYPSVYSSFKMDW